MTDILDHSDTATIICRLAIEAGAKALEIYRAEIIIETKDDASPVTEADRAGEEIILQGLAEHFSAVPVLAEESAAIGKIPALGSRFFLVDPLDGTKEFIKKTGEFTVNIALVEDGRPVLGVVYAPALNRIFYGDQVSGAWACEVDAGFEMGERQPISARKANPEQIVAVASRSHRSQETDEFLSTLAVADFAAAGSSLKFCLLAEGKADIYPRFGRTMEWDTGAGQAVLEAAGGHVFQYPDMAPLRYNKSERDFDNPYFIALGRSPEIAKI